MVDGFRSVMQGFWFLTSSAFIVFNISSIFEDVTFDFT